MTVDYLALAEELEQYAPQAFDEGYGNEHSRDLVLRSRRLHPLFDAWRGAL